MKENLASINYLYLKIIFFIYQPQDQAVIYLFKKVFSILEF